MRDSQPCCGLQTRLDQMIWQDRRLRVCSCLHYPPLYSGARGFGSACQKARNRSAETQPGCSGGGYGMIIGVIMAEIEKARMGMIAVAVVMLESVARRLMGTRRLSSGMTTMVAAGVVLLVAAGGASALPACPAPGNTVITASCELAQSYGVPADQTGYIIGADDVVIDGKGYTITGAVSSSDCSVSITAGEFTGESQPAKHAAVVNKGYKNVVIKNLKIGDFCTGISLKNAENTMVTDCDIYSNGKSGEITHGVHMAGVWNSAITNNKIHSNTGSVCGCGGGGNGIFTYGGDSPAYLGDDNTITYNHLYDNEKSGFFSKKKCANNIVSYNNVTGNRAGGITLRCANTDNTIVEYNYIADNLGAGIYFRATNNIIRYNTVVNNKDGSLWVSCGSPTNAICDDGVGIEVQDGAANAQIYDNIVCDNDARDIEDRSGELTGDDNTCDTTSNYDDDGTTGCTFSCSPPEKPDLAITAKSETLTGSTFKVTYIVKNTGGADAGASTTGIYVGGTQVATDLVGALAAGASHTRTVTIGSFDCPCGTTVMIKVCADEGDAVDESDETNNCLENAFSCPSCPGEPDLVITEKSETLVGSAFTVTYTVKNNGGGDAGASTTCIYADGAQITTDPVGALAAGATHEGTVVIGSFDCPCGMPVTVKVCADKDSTVDESDETNNCRDDTFSCPSRPSPPPSPPADVPTFTPIGMFAMVGLLGIAGMSVIRRR